MALGVIDTLSAAGVRVPEDVMVTGYDNIMSARLSNPPLSTVAIDSNKQYYFGMQVLIDRIDGTETREEVIFPYELILSESCGCKEAEGRDQARIEFFQQTQLLKRFYLMVNTLFIQILPKRTRLGRFNIGEP
jgi:ABC-type sugar transport system substrate-binding protein